MKKIIVLLMLLITFDVFAKGARVSIKTSSIKTGGGISSVVGKTAKVNLSGPNIKGATGGKATKLFESFKARNTKPTLNKADIDNMFKPDYRRNMKREYYSGYSARQYSRGYEDAMASHSTNYGFWDGVMFKTFLDGSGDRRMYYNHQNDREFVAWRNDANEACKNGDQQVCDDLKDLDNDIKQYQSKKPDPTYVTDGIDTGVYLKDTIDVSQFKTLRICTGSLSSDYDRFSKELEKITRLKVETVASQGSIDNAKKLASAECDLAFIQDDVYSPDLTKLATLPESEVGFLACHKKGNVKTLSDAKTVYVGSDQTGSQFTFTKLTDKHPVVDGTTLQFINNHENDVNACLFAVSTANFTVFQQLDTLNNFTLVPIDGKHNYAKTILKSSHYKNLTDKRFIGFFHNDNGWFAPSGTPTIDIKTILVTTKSWMADNAQLGELLLLNRDELQKALH